jgi:hypothetical protein
MTEPNTISDVVEWIDTIDDETLDVVLAALQRRHDELHESRARQATPGSTVVLHDVTPTYLDGLEGVIEEVDDDEGLVSIRLTRTSTGRLRFTGRSEYKVGQETNFLLTGVPASCCYPAADRRIA